MADQNYFDILPLKPSRILSNSPWVTQQHTANVQRNEKQTINQMSYCVKNAGEIRKYVGEDVTLSESPAQQYQTSHEHSDNIDTWNPMDDDFACPTFNSYKRFDILTAERPKERSPDKNIRQSPEKRAEEISLYVGNIPVGINQEGIRNLFLAVGQVQSCQVLPPKDPSSNTRYGFVKFYTWREAIKAIETYDGFYVGNNLKLRVRVAHQRRDDGDLFSRDDEDSFSEEVVQDPQTSNDPAVIGCNINEDENTTDPNMITLPEPPMQVHHANCEQVMEEKSSNDTSKTSSAATPRTMLPCTCCEKLCTQRCSACKAPYCSRECQKLDKARHKLVCSYSSTANTPKPKPTNPPAPTPAQSQAALEEPVPDTGSDSDFDCIDISLDGSCTLIKENTSKHEVTNTRKSSVGNLAFDSGYTSSKEGMGHAVKNQSEMVMAKDEIQHSNLPVAQKAPDENFLAYVTAVSASNTIWAVARTPDYARFCELTTQMTELEEESLERINVASVGSLCLARFSVDNGWYRSRITQGNAEQVEVIFVDYGNTEWKHIHDLYQLPPGFADVPSQAQQFTLNGLIQTANSKIEQLMVKFLDSLVTDKTFFIQLVCSAPGCIPEVILQQNESHVSINQQMLNYREQQALNIIGQQNEAEKSIQSTEVLERSEALQEIVQQGTTSEPRNLMISYMSDNISPDDQMIASMTDYTIDDTLVSDRTSGIVSDNIPVNDTRANYVTCTTTPNNSINGFNDPSVDNPICDYSWEHVPEDFSKTVCVAKSISRKNSSSSYVSDNVPLFSSNADLINLSSNNPVGNYSSENISESFSKSVDASENISSKNSSSSCVSDNVPASDLIPDFTPNDPMSSYVSDLNPANQLPNTGFKLRMASQVPRDVLPSTKTFEILVCHFLTPSLFWIWFFDSAMGIFNQLSSMLSTTYEHSTYSEYLPINGELIAAKYTDGIWYRAAVECINSDGSLRVHFIDFGNSEDVSLIDVRRITAALATIPRLATKCALHGMEKPTGNWSTECVQFCNYLMLNKRGVATVRNEVQSTLFLSVDMDINGQVGSVVDELMKQGYFITNNMHTQHSDRHVIPTSSNDASNNDSATLRNQPLVSDNKPSFPESPTSHVNQPVSRPPLSFHHELPLPENKAAIPGSQSDISEPATLGTVPLVSGTKLHLPASQPVSRNNNPVFPNMKPPLPCNQPIALNDQLHFPESKPVVLGNQPVYPNQNPALNPVLSNNEPVSSAASQLVFPGSKPVLRCKILTPLNNKQPVSDTNLACDGSKLLVSPNVVPSTLETNKQNILGNLPRPFETLVTNPSQSISVKVEKTDDAKPTSASLPSIHNCGKQFNAPSYPLSQIPPHTILDAHNVEPRHKTLPLPTVPTTSFKVIVNDVLSADKFYAQMTDPNLVNQLHKCVRALNEYVTKTQPSKVENVQVGSFGCAKFSQDDVWYRAQVVNIDEQKYVVRFIDFGNIENVEPHMFLEAPEFFFQLAPQTICCRLGTSDHIWGKRSREMMKKLTLNKQLSCTVLAGSSLLQYAVQLQDSVGGEVVDIAEKLSEAMGCRRTVTLPSSRPLSSKQASVFSEKVLVPAITASGIEKIGGKHEVYVCSTSHPTFFWVQSAKNVEILKRLQNDLEIHYSNNSYPPFQPEMNSFCALLSPINNKWYRAFVKSTSPKGGLLVHCVDFGYLLSAEEGLLRPLEEKFLIQPIGAMLLSINNVEPIVGKLWSEEAIKYFRDKVQSKVVKIHLVFNSKARLFVDVYDPDSIEESSLRTALVEGGMAKETQKNSPKIEETQQKLASNDVPKAACEDQMSKLQNVANSTLVDSHFNARSSSSQSQDLVYQGISTINSESQDAIGIIHIPDSTLYEDTQGLNEVPDFFSRQDTYATQSSSVSCNIPRNTNLQHQNTGEEQSPSSSPHQNQGSSGNDPSKFNATSDKVSKPDVIPKENQLDVFVSWVDSPDSFWVQHAVLATVRSYASMSQQLNATCENSSEKILNPKLGDFCCSKFAGEWCRCKLVALLGKRLARVFYIDFGNCEDVELAKLKPLTEEFRVLPGQAMECTLADVHPRDGGWTPQSVQWLRDRILDKTLEAAVVQWSGNSLRVRLYDKSSSEPNASINSLMLQSGI